MGNYKQHAFVGIAISTLLLLMVVFGGDKPIAVKNSILASVAKSPCHETLTFVKSPVDFTLPQPAENSQNGNESMVCIEKNICRNPSSGSPVYFYHRTDFDSRVEEPVDYKASISHPVPVVPRLVHFCLFTDGNFTFEFYYMLAIMAAERFAKPDRIFFWHDNLPKGEFWEETKRRIPNLYLVHRERPTSIRGNKVKVIEHVSDIVRLEALLEYGGMYFDMDSIVVNPIDPLLHFDVTMGHAVSYVLANGIMFSKPWSDFFKIWHHEYKTFNDTEWGDHSVIMPWQIAMNYTNLIHVEPTTLCRPNFLEKEFLYGDKYWDWRNKNYVVHLYTRLGDGIARNPENIKKWNTTVGSIMRYIYYSDSDLIME